MEKNLSRTARAILISLLGACTLASLTIANAGVQGRRARVQHVFMDGVNDGATPNDLVRDLQGDLYGTTYQGGAHGDGTVYKLAPDGSYRVLYAFGAKHGGAHPWGGLLLLADGSLVGSAGRADGQTGSVVYKLSPDGLQHVLHRFGVDDPLGYGPDGLISDSAGNLYGVTRTGGPYKCGTAFRLSADGKADSIYAFRGTDDGCGPSSPMTFDAAGNLYGTTMLGGSENAGVVYKIAPDGTETILHTFAPNTQDDGFGPTGRLLLDAAGNIFGTTRSGNERTAYDGTVYKLAPDGTETVLHRFMSTIGSYGPDGELPAAGVIADSNGNLYGTTLYGGKVGNGTVFEISPRGRERILHWFLAPEGTQPLSLLLGDNGSLIGTAQYCGTNGGTCQQGTVFEIALH